MKEKKGCAIAFTAGIVFFFLVLFVLYFGSFGIGLAALLPGGAGLLLGALALGAGLLVIAMLIYIGLSRVKEIEEENKDDYRNY